MNFRRTLQFLSLPAALGLGTALVIACSDSGPTESTIGQEQVQGPQPMAAPKKTAHGTIDNEFVGVASCKPGWYPATVNTPGSGADDNGDGFVCSSKVPKKN